MMARRACSPCVRPAHTRSRKTRRRASCGACRVPRFNAGRRSTCDRSATWARPSHGPCGGRGEVAAVLARAGGMRLDPAAVARLDRCVEMAAADGSLTIDEFLDRLAVDDAVVQELLDRVTVQETWFFRDPAHFEAAAEILRTA